MSYFDDAFESYILKIKDIMDDGYGGYIVDWKDGPIIKAALDLGSSTEVRKANAEKLQTVFTITLPKNTPVENNSYIQNVETGAIYKVTGDPKDNQTPNGAMHPTCYATAIRTELPDGQNASFK